MIFLFGLELTMNLKLEFYSLFEVEVPWKQKLTILDAFPGKFLQTWTIESIFAFITEKFFFYFENFHQVGLRFPRKVLWKFSFQSELADIESTRKTFFFIRKNHILCFQIPMKYLNKSKGINKKKQQHIFLSIFL